ncbi:hypothetical protein [Abyssisolibacter fermentans]|uniref:hypothetical protein n=1 Tax=Abyssisolibacter fermentans TaxID=1766203 RepID=UPI0012E3E5FD|nr:hypothetical protein [Abyssisolibacter fermentans]
MFIVIEIDNEFTLGIDQSKGMKGIRLGFIAIHIVNLKFETFIKKVSKYLD